MARSGLEEVLPLTPLQEGLLFHGLYDRGSRDVYLSQLVLDIEGDLDAAALRAAATTLLRRHAALRVGFRHEGLTRPVQIVLREAAPPWTDVDLTADAADGPDRERAFEALLDADRERPLDPERPPLLRLTLVRCGPDRHRLVLTYHHLLLDGWSFSVLLRELLALYGTGGDDGALPPPAPYRQHLSWLAARDQDAARAAWREALRGLPPVAPLAPDGAAPRTPERLVFTLDEAETSALTESARTLGVTLNTVLQAAWATVLGQHTGAQDVVFETTVAGRPAELPGAAGMVGLFVNTVPVRVRFRAEEPVAALLSRLQREQAALGEHHHLGLAEIQRQAPEPGPLFDTLLAFENYPAGSPLPGTEAPAGAPRITGVRTREQTHYPLTVMVLPGPGTLEFRLDHRPDLLGDALAPALAGQLRTVLRELARRTDTPWARLDTLTAGERARVLGDWSGTARTLPGATGSVPARFAAQAAATPDAVAVRAGARTLTYAELDAASDALAAHLAAEAPGPEEPVLLLMRRSPELVTATLAVLKTGAAYVPLHPGHPPARRRETARRAGARLLLTDRASAADAEAVDAARTLVVDDPGAPVPAAVPRVGADAPDRLAYVMFTSGSTGEPKGVAVSHRAVLDLAAHGGWRNGAHERVLTHSPHAFDASTYELWVPLLSGGTAVLLPDGDLDLDVLARTLAEGRVTAAFLTSGLFRLVAEEAPAALAGLREVWTGGDRVSASAVRRVRAHCPELTVVDVYGPTETTTFATGHPLPADRPVPDSLPIGRPLDGTRAYVLDDLLRPAAPGAPGELYLAGAGLARGYLGRPDATAERFVADPFGPPGARMYRTGDVVRWTRTGEIEYVGRSDDQVKIRGFRIELAEIEAALAIVDGITEAAVAVHDDRLAAYVTGPAIPAPDVLRTHLSATLPHYMLPSAYMTLDALPLTANGKLNRRALPAPEFTATTGRAPRTPREEVLTRLFTEVLALDHVTIDDDFFTLGGDSIRSLTLVARAREAGLDFTVRDVFDHKTPAHLAEAATATTLHAHDPAQDAEPLLTGLSAEELDRLHSEW
ncbi:amino acid adenylation domain-containing protein [Streptomyces sp. NPDC050388]|uniref:non-ribosomal peptide synthetase n=1 Tax=Streptomyces sp. NPDC050388 TaxID=3155781 RepID=UPI003440D987